MMNSWVRMCSTCWSVGIGIARAVSIARSTSVWVTSLSLIATMPVELKLLMWLPAIPVKTRSILQSAISSASSSVRWIAFTVVSMLTTTPFFRPFDSWPPMPTMSMRPSGKSSATTATTLEVPMSSATMRFLFSLAMSGPPVSVGIGRADLDCALGCVYGETVRVAQVDVVNSLARSAEGLRVHRDKARDSVLDAVPLGVAPELQREAARELHLPGEARAERHLRRREPERSERLPEGDVAPDDVGLASSRSGEQRKRFVAPAAEHLAVRVDELRIPFLLAPAPDRHLFLDAHFQAVGPFAPQLRPAHPRYALEERADRLQVDREERAPHASLERVHDVAALDAVEVAADDYRLQEEHRRLYEHAAARVREQGECERGQHAGGGVRCARAIPHVSPPPRGAPVPGSSGRGLRRTAPRGERPWARASGRSCPARCSPRGNTACPCGRASRPRGPIPGIPGPGRRTGPRPGRCARRPEAGRRGSSSACRSPGISPRSRRTPGAFPA